MASRGEATRERILAVTEAAVLAKGFGATSIDEIIAEAGLTKSGFFYHFRDKNELAQILLQRYRERDDKLLDEVFARGRELGQDPLQGFLIGLKLLAETMADLPRGHPGCLVATYAYQERLFDRDVRELNRDIIFHWRARFRGLLGAIHDEYAPREPVDLDRLADMVSTVIEGGLVLGKAVGDATILPAQIMLLRSYIKLLFEAGRR
jgi:TetR/AcrR family transcriptional regulator, transcriptional repressor for nem operon